MKAGFFLLEFGAAMGHFAPVRAERNFGAHVRGAVPKRLAYGAAAARVRSQSTAPPERFSQGPVTPIQQLTK
jgi:hypothetical protein